MPPKSDHWIPFETAIGPNGKPLKYLTDQFHLAAWCRGCVSRFVELMMANEAVSIMSGDLTKGKEKSEWINLGRRWRHYCVIMNLLTSSDDFDSQKRRSSIHGS